MASCYRKCLERALQHDLHSIAFPAISTGVYGFPKQEAAELALDVIHAYIDKIRVIVCLHSREDLALYRSVCNSLGTITLDDSSLGL